MRTLLVLSIYLGAFFLFTACAQESGSLVAQDPQPYVQPTYIPPDTRVPRQQFPWVTLDGGESDTEFNPRVDILFVVDNSDSMKDAQKNLSDNINRFTNEIFQNKDIDYHIGVISVWDDSPEFSKNKKDTYGIGELRFAKKAGQQLTRRYVDRKDDPSTLAETLKIGVAPLAEGGPENEVFFSPVLAALEKTGRGAANEEFFRQDAQLVVIFMTDADEFKDSKATAQQVVDAMIASKGGNAAKVSAYGVLVSANSPETSKDWGLRIHPKYHPECFDFDAKGKVLRNNGTCTKPFGPEKLESLIFAANDKMGATAETLRKQFIMSILSPKFGDDLANIGGDIKRKTLEKEIFLGAKVPRQKDGQYQIRVRYGNTEQLAKGKGRVIERDIKKGWSYNPTTNSIRLSGEINYEYIEGARFAVDIQVYQ